MELHKGKLLHKIYNRGMRRQHVAVLLHEAVEHLMAAGPDGRFVDCTFGRGGHSELILSKLSPAGRLIAFDIDPMSVSVGRELEGELADGALRRVAHDAEGLLQRADAAALAARAEGGERQVPRRARLP